MLSSPFFLPVSQNQSSASTLGSKQNLLWHIWYLVYLNKQDDRELGTLKTSFLLPATHCSLSFTWHVFSEHLYVLSTVLSSGNIAVNQTGKNKSSWSLHCSSSELYVPCDFTILFSWSYALKTFLISLPSRRPLLNLQQRLDLPF